MSSDGRVRTTRILQRIVSRHRVQRGLNWSINGAVVILLLLLGVGILHATGTDIVSVAPRPALALAGALLLGLFCIGTLLPVEERLLYYETDRRLGLGAALLTSWNLLRAKRPLSPMEETQLNTTARRTDALSSELLHPWRPPAALLALPLLALLLPAVWLLPSGSPGNGPEEARFRIRELAERLAVRGEETEDPRYRDLARLLRELAQSGGNDPRDRAGAGEELGFDRARGLERIPPVEGETLDPFDYDEALDELFRMAPSRSEEGYALSRSLAEALGLDREEFERLEERIAELDQENPSAEPNSPGSGSPSSGDGEDSTGERETGGNEEGGDGGERNGSADGGDRDSTEERMESGPGAGSGSGEARERREQSESRRAAGGELEELRGSRRSEEQLRGSLRYLSPEGRALVEEREIETEYRLERESSVGGRIQEGPGAAYVGDYFELLNRQNTTATESRE